MKKAIIFATVLLSAVAQANPYHHGYRPHHRHHSGPSWGWVVPAVITGAIVYGATRPAPQTAPIVYVPPGMTPPPLGYRYEQLLDANCNCYRWVLVQGQ